MRKEDTFDHNSDNFARSNSDCIIIKSTPDDSIDSSSYMYYE